MTSTIQKESLDDFETFDAAAYTDAVCEVEGALRQRLNEFTELKDPTKLRIAKELVGQEGAIDAEIEGLTNLENQRDLSIKFHWGHNHFFSNDFVQKGRMGDRHLNMLAQFSVMYDLPEMYFKDKDIIDVGCWTGGTTLLLKMLGAGHVLALEEVQKYANTARRLLEDVYDQKGITCDGTNLYDLQTDKKYDIVYFPGVIYHLSDPVLGLRRLFNALKDGGVIFVESAGINAKGSVCSFFGNRVGHESAKAESAEQLNRGGWNWFLPSPLCLERWMSEAGFDDVDSFYSPVTERVFGFGRRNRHVEITRAGLSDRTIE